MRLPSRREKVLIAPPPDCPPPSMEDDTHILPTDVTPLSHMTYSHLPSSPSREGEVLTIRLTTNLYSRAGVSSGSPQRVWRAVLRTRARSRISPRWNTPSSPRTRCSTRGNDPERPFTSARTRAVAPLIPGRFRTMPRVCQSSEERPAPSMAAVTCSARETSTSSWIRTTTVSYGPMRASSSAAAAPDRGCPQFSSSWLMVTLPSQPTFPPSNWAYGIASVSVQLHRGSHEYHLMLSGYSPSLPRYCFCIPTIL